MVKLNYEFIKNFHKSRQNKIGASDIPYLIPHPEKQFESLAAFTNSTGKRQYNTAIDLYNEKINGKDWEYSFPAEMGHFLEVKALYEFIADNIDINEAKKFMKGYQLHKIDSALSYQNPKVYNNTPFLHNTESNTDFGVAHADCIYDPDKNDELEKKIIKVNGLKIDMNKPFILEAKTARLYTVKSRKKDIYTGYDLELKSWQGIPLKVYFQVQFQMLLYNIDIAYVSLIFDTSEKKYWQIKANKKHQRELKQIAEYMKRCIDDKSIPKKLVMNSSDICKLYPEISDDFRELVDEEKEEVMDIIKKYNDAKDQEKIWKQKKEDFLQSISIHLKDTETLKIMIDGSLKSVAKWKKTGGCKKIMGLSEIKKLPGSKRLIKYMERNKLLKETNKNRIPNITFKGEIDE